MTVDYWYFEYHIGQWSGLILKIRLDHDDQDNDHEDQGWRFILWSIDFFGTVDNKENIETIYLF